MGRAGFSRVASGRDVSGWPAGCSASGSCGIRGLCPTPFFTVFPMILSDSVTESAVPGPLPEPKAGVPAPPLAGNPSAEITGPGAPAIESPPAAAGSEQEGTGTEIDFDESEPLTPDLVEEEAIRGDFVLRWGVVLLAFLLASTRIGDTDTSVLLHVKTGQFLAS